MSEQSTIQAVMIDMVSIQAYIFASNKLKENIGAEYLVKESYRGPLQTVIDAMYPGISFDRERWRTNPTEIFQQSPNFDMGYVGGGNALLLFNEGNADLSKHKAREFIQNWTFRLLREAPGIITAVAYHATTKTELTQQFANVTDALERGLAVNRAKSLPQTTLPRHGITAECPRSGLSMETMVMVEGERRYVSSFSAAKLIAVSKANQELLEEFKPVLGQQYTFTDDLDLLGQKSGEDSHIAIVHLDGNDMGLEFQGKTSLAEFRDFSNKVETATKAAFRKVIELVVRHYEPIMTWLGWNPNKQNYPANDEGQWILPIRLIVRGGDDLTFVCDSRLGVYLAQTCLEFFETQQKEATGKTLTACAGVAIIKTKYPFYRGYELAEDLCSSAKKFRRTSEKSASYLDYHIAMGGIFGDLQEIRRKHFQAAQGNLVFRPYRIGTQAQHDGHDLNAFLKAVQILRDPEKFPRNKVQDLRQILSLSESATQQFMHELKFRERDLPPIEGGTYHTRLFDHGQTPYLDMIELLEYYPVLPWKPTQQTSGGTGA